MFQNVSKKKNPSYPLGLNGQAINISQKLKLHAASAFLIPCLYG